MSLIWAQIPGHSEGCPRSVKFRTVHVCHELSSHFALTQRECWFGEGEGKGCIQQLQPLQSFLTTRLQPFGQAAGQQAFTLPCFLEQPITAVRMLKSPLFVLISHGCGSLCGAQLPNVHILKALQAELRPRHWLEELRNTARRLCVGRGAVGGCLTITWCLLLAELSPSIHWLSPGGSSGPAYSWGS